jgi:uncharacterized protein (DUF1330 family)
MNNNEKHAYFMVQIKAKNFVDLLERYAKFAIPGGEMIAGSAAPKVLEGDWDGNWAAVLRFPDMAAAEAWYNSTEYRPLRDLRKHELTESGRVVRPDRARGLNAPHRPGSVRDGEVERRSRSDLVVGRTSPTVAADAFGLIRIVSSLTTKIR